MMIKTALIFDDGTAHMPGFGVSDEVRNALSSMTTVLGLDPDQKIFDVAWIDSKYTKEFSNINFDLVVLDYGGMSVWGASATAMVHVEEFCWYAKEHPGTLLVIWTEHTANIYRYELTENFQDLDNIVCRFREYHAWDDDMDGSDDFQDKFRAWFSSEVNDVLQDSPDQITD